MNVVIEFFNAVIWSDVLAVAATLFFIMDPLGNIPVFNGLLSRFTPTARTRIFLREMLIALVILLLFLYGGTTIMSFLGLTQSSLNIAGGTLLFIIAMRMIFPRPQQAEEEFDDPFIVPLAIPMVAGPSTLAVLLVLSSSQPERVHEWCLALLLAWGVSTLILAISPLFLRVLGNRGLRALERLMGMLLIMLAVQMLLNGVTEFVQSLGLVPVLTADR